VYSIPQGRCCARRGPAREGCRSGRGGMSTMSQAGRRWRKLAGRVAQTGNRGDGNWTRGGRGMDHEYWMPCGVEGWIGGRNVGLVAGRLSIRGAAGRSPQRRMLERACY
jgi:hypothetical protein